MQTWLFRQRQHMRTLLLSHFGSNIVYFTLLGPSSVILELRLRSLVSEMGQWPISISLTILRILHQLRNASQSSHELCSRRQIPCWCPSIVCNWTLCRRRTHEIHSTSQSVPVLHHYVHRLCCTQHHTTWQHRHSYALRNALLRKHLLPNNSGTGNAWSWKIQ